MKRFVEKNKGITLIALIITIIVMLILVAVTINVALNGGIFNKAKDAKDKTNLAKEEEILQTTALGYLQKNSGYVNLGAFAEAYEENGLEGYTITYDGEASYATATKGEQTFYITKQGGITEIEPQSSVVPSEPEYYIISLGEYEFVRVVDYANNKLKTYMGPVRRKFDIR